MKLNTLFKTILVVILSWFIFYGCSSSDSEDGAGGPQGTLHFSIKNTGTSDGINSTSYKSNIQYSSSFDSSLSVSESIISGPPEEFFLTVTGIFLVEDSGNERTVFSDSNGKVLKIDQHSIDLSELFGVCINKITGEEISCDICINEEGAEEECSDENSPSDTASINIAASNYNKVKIQFKKKSQIKGCLSGVYSGTSSSEISGEHTYCTKTASSPYVATETQNEDFESQPAEMMDFPLDSVNDLYPDASETLDYYFPIPSGLALEEDVTAQLTLLIDTNRLLRFHNQGRADGQAPSPQLPGDKSYFFDSTFANTMFIFAGQPGKIEGYSFLVQLCITSLSGVFPEDHLCPNNELYGKGWMTLVYDSQSNPLLVSFSADDDNYAGIKGTNRHFVDSEYMLDTDYFHVTTDGNWSIDYTLGHGDLGTLYNFEPVEKDLNIEGDMYFEYRGELNSFFGLIQMKREL